MEPILRYAIASDRRRKPVDRHGMALVTRWGLLRHRWVGATVWLTAIAVALLFVHMSTEVPELTACAVDPAVDPRTDRADLPNTIAGLLLVCVPLVLNLSSHAA